MSEPAQTAAGGLQWLPHAPELSEGGENQAQNLPPVASPDSLQALYEPLGGQTAVQPVITQSPPITAAVPAWLKPTTTVKPEPNSPAVAKPWPAIVQNSSPPIPTAPEKSLAASAVAENFTAVNNMPGIYYPTAVKTPPSTGLFGPQVVAAKPTEATVIEKIITPPTITPKPTPAPVPVAKPLLNYGEISLNTLKPPVITQSQTVPNAAIPPPMVMGGRISSRSVTSPVMTKVLSLLFLIVGGIYLVYCGAYLLLGSMFNAILHESSGLGFVFLKEQPLLGVVPLIFLMSGILFFWTGIYLKEGSRTGWVMGVLIGFGIPMIIYFLNTYLWPEIGTLMLMALTTTKLMINLGWLISNKYFLYQLIPLLLGLITLISFRSFGEGEGGNNRHLKAICGLVTFFLIFIVGGLMAGAYAYALSTNFGYKTIMTEVDFHVYRPKTIPNARTYKTGFSINNGEGMLNGRTDFVQVAFDYPLGAQAKKGGSSPIILRQVDVPGDFNIKAFAGSLLTGIASPSAVVVQGALQETGYALETTSPQGSLRAVTFTTPLKVLVFISSTKANLNDLITLANNLE